MLYSDAKLIIFEDIEIRDYKPLQLFKKNIPQPSQTFYAILNRY